MPLLWFFRLATRFKAARSRRRLELGLGGHLEREPDRVSKEHVQATPQPLLRGPPTSTAGTQSSSLGFPGLL